MKRASSGYTLMEVMVSLAVLAVGAAGVIGLQKVTGVANSYTRNLATASRIAAKWVERLELDGRQWSDTTGFGSTYWLKSATAAPGQWTTPVERPSFASPDADVLGADIFPGDTADPAFCTQVRLTTLSGFSGAIRAEVRVFWEKAGDPINCNVTGDAVNAAPSRYGSVHNVIAIVASK